MAEIQDLGSDHTAITGSLPLFQKFSMKLTVITLTKIQLRCYQFSIHVTVIVLVLCHVTDKMAPISIFLDIISIFTLYVIA